MSQYDGTFRTFYGSRTVVSVEFRRNFVDLLVARTLSRYRPQAISSSGRLHATLVRKFKYNDTAPMMGLWLYRIEQVGHRGSLLAEQMFEEFPNAFRHVQPPEPGVPDIFDDPPYYSTAEKIASYCGLDRSKSTGRKALETRHSPPRLKLSDRTFALTRHMSPSRAK